MSDYRRWFIPGGTFYFTVVRWARYSVVSAECHHFSEKEASVPARDEPRRPNS
jgi:hypothetical protein